MSRVRTLPLLALLAACSGGLDDTVGSEEDAGPLDAGLSGGGAREDAGGPDGGGADAGALDDAGSPLDDAGSGMDGGATDASTSDASTSDAGTSDAGTGDAGTNDAGTADDAGAADGGTNDAGASGDGGAPFTLSGDLDLTRDTLSPGRSCAEAPQFSLVGLSTSAATLATAPSDDCLVAGDEVLLISLQGTDGAAVNVGNWELLRVESVAGSEVTFTTPHQRHYGDGASLDSDIGVAAGDQKVALIRVPNYGALHVASGATVTAAAWDGLLGGVVALRATSLEVDGVITAARLGYRGGRWSQDGQDCTQNIQTESGESYTGPARAQSAANGGGAGGIAAADGPLYNSNSPISPSAGHATQGEPGMNANGRTLGEVGQPYGAPGAATLTMGSGASGNLTCTLENTVPILTAVPGDHRGGGIVMLLGGSITVGAEGAITATPVDQTRDTASAGGYVYLRGTSVAVGDGRVTARGSRALAVNGPVAGMFNHGSVGYVAIESTGPVTGTTDPAANANAN